MTKETVTTTFILLESWKNVLFYFECIDYFQSPFCDFGHEICSPDLHGNLT